jgi:hypothetical protein
VRYEFEAQGSDGGAAHSYAFVPPGDDFRIEPPQSASMLCFEEGLPVPEDTLLINANLRFAAYESPLPVSDLQTHFDLELVPAWENVDNTVGGGRVYRRMLDDNTQCTLSLRFGVGRDGATTIAANVLTSLINPDDLAVTDDLASPVVVQSLYTLSSVPYSGQVSEAVSALETQYVAEGWQPRPELTDIRLDAEDPAAHSAFMVFTQDEQELYLTIDSRPDGTALVSTQIRAGLCGPTFDVPEAR